MMMYGYGGGFGSMLWGLTMFVSMLLPVIIIVGIVYLGISLWEKKRKAPLEETRQDPLSILKKRYASGEITKEEFGKLKEEIL